MMMVASRVAHHRHGGQVSSHTSNTWRAGYLDGDGAGAFDVIGSSDGSSYDYIRAGSDD